jgi:hypothetical protein
MNLSQIKKKLDKVNRFFSYLESNEEELAGLDKDAFMASIRQLYEACVITEHLPQTVATKVPSNVIQEETLDEGPQFVFVQHNQPKQEVDTTQKQPKKKPAVVQEDTLERIEEKQSVQDQQEAVVVPSVQPAQEATKSSAFNQDFEGLFSFKAATDISQKLSETPLKDLSKALGLNEKFLYINELFAGDVVQFQEAIKQLNDAKDFDEARMHLENDLIQQYDWMNKQKNKLAKDFVKLVRRRYL